MMFGLAKATKKTRLMLSHAQLCASCIATQTLVYSRLPASWPCMHRMPSSTITTIARIDFRND